MGTKKYIGLALLATVFSGCQYVPNSDTGVTSTYHLGATASEDASDASEDSGSDVVVIQHGSLNQDCVNGAVELLSPNPVVISAKNEADLISAVNNMMSTTVTLNNPWVIFSAQNADQNGTNVIQLYVEDGAHPGPKYLVSADAAGVPANGNSVYLSPKNGKLEFLSKASNLVPIANQVENGWYRFSKCVIFP